MKTDCFFSSFFNAELWGGHEHDEKPKKFRKKAIGLSLAFMLVISGIVPANVFAGTEGGDSESAKNPAAQQEAEAGTEKGTGKGAEKTEKSTRQDSRVGSDKDVSRDEAGADVNGVSDVSKEEKGTAKSDSKLALSGPEDKEKARAYLVENYITKNKVITTGGDGVIKSSDGLT